jgi:hypothetical protein
MCGLQRWLVRIIAVVSVITKAQGKHLGRPKLNLDTLSREQIKTLREQYTERKDGRITAVEFMQLLDLKKNTFYKIRGTSRVSRKIYAKPIYGWRKLIFLTLRVAEP